MKQQTYKKSLFKRRVKKPDIVANDKSDSEDDLNANIKNLNKAKNEKQGRILKNFEAMDQIYKRVRNRTNEGLT